MTLLQVNKFGHQAFTWAPPSVQMVRIPKTTGCRCHGTGSLGTLVEPIPGGAELRKEIPCPCLHMSFPEDRKQAIAAELESHFEQVKEQGTLCPCWFCVQRRRAEAGVDVEVRA